MTMTRYIPLSAVGELTIRLRAEDRDGDLLRPRLMVRREDAEAMDPQGRAAKVTIEIEGVE